LVITAEAPCIDSKEYCESTNWELCINSNVYHANCCWSCHKLVEIDEDSESCYAEGYNDIMSATECAHAAAQEDMAYIEVDSTSDNSDYMPVGCSRAGSTDDIYQWNPAQRSDEYEVGDDPIRVCLQSRRPTAYNDLRTYVPSYMDMRAVMDTWDYGDSELRSLETAFTCADIEPSCELVPDAESCSNIADDEDLRMVISSDPYIPGGCFYYDNEITWNEGNYIAFPPPVSSAYYSHICRNCRKDNCPLPVWLWFVLAALGLIICITSVCCCCFNFQTKTFRLPSRSGLNLGAPGVQATPMGYDFDAIGNRERISYPSTRDDYPYRLSDTWETPKVPMNLFNKPAS